MFKPVLWVVVPPTFSMVRSREFPVIQLLWEKIRIRLSVPVTPVSFRFWAGHSSSAHLASFLIWRQRIRVYLPFSWMSSDMYWPYRCEVIPVPADLRGGVVFTSVCRQWNRWTPQLFCVQMTESLALSDDVLEGYRNLILVLKFVMTL
jgi:hypothetical protein